MISAASIRARALDAAARHRRGIVATVVASMAGFTVTAFGLAPLMPDAAQLPVRTLSQVVQPDGLTPQSDALAALPGHARVCCTHEYTLANLRFAMAADPDNATLARHYATCQTLRDQQRPTLPSTLALELQINPFLRSRLPALIKAAQAFDAHASDEVSVFAALRQWKNQF